MQDKVVLITGASSGIGRATAELFVDKSARVAALGRSEDAVRQAVKGLKQRDGQAIPLIADISHPQQVEKAVQQLIDRWGRLDVVFANAGINGVWAPIDELSPEEWQKTLDTNLTGTFGAGQPRRVSGTSRPTGYPTATVSRPRSVRGCAGGGPGT